MATFADSIKQVLSTYLRRIQELRSGNPGLFDMIAIAAALLIAAGAGVAAFASRGNAVLAGNLSAADRIALQVRLRQEGIPYALEQDTITVPDSRLNEARQLLSSVPGFAGGESGFSIFDRSNLGQSAFAEQVSYQRALQGELERTIMNIRGVENARVMLAFDPPSPFALGPQSSARASVLLTPASGAVIDEISARAIAHLVAGSVQGLSPDQVVVTTDEGMVLFPPQHGGKDEADEVLSLRQKIEHDLESKADGLLNGIVGEGRYRLAVSVDLDREKLQETLHEYGSSKNEALVSEEHSEEPASGAEPAGIPGLTSNLPAPAPLSSPAAGASPAAAASPASSPRSTPAPPAAAPYARKDIVNYEPSSREIHKVSEPLSVRRLSLAAVVDGTYRNGVFEPLPPERLKELRTLLIAVVGADPSRGDMVEVSSAALTHPYIPPPPGLQEQIQQFASNPRQLLGAIAAGVLLVVGAVWMTMRKLRRVSAERRFKRSIQRADSDRAVIDQPPETGATAPSQTEVDLRIRASLQAERFPDAGAAILRRWLEEGTNSTSPANEAQGS